jgi:hypothetical protein
MPKYYTVTFGGTNVPSGSTAALGTMLRINGVSLSKYAFVKQKPPGLIKVKIHTI